jgi:hypothetical protein
MTWGSAFQFLPPGPAMQAPAQHLVATAAAERATQATVVPPVQFARRLGETCGPMSVDVASSEPVVDFAKDPTVCPLCRAGEDSGGSVDGERGDFTGGSSGQLLQRRKRTMSRKRNWCVLQYLKASAYSNLVQISSL